MNITTPPPPPMDGRGTNHKQEGLHTKSLSWSGLEIKKILRWTNWRNIVARCKFLVASLYNVNDAAHSQFHAARFTKTRKISRNSVEILSMSVRHIWNFFQLLGLFTCRKLVNLSENFVTEMCKQRPETPKLPGVDYVAKNWAPAMMLKALPLVHFWSVLLLKEQNDLF